MPVAILFYHGVKSVNEKAQFFDRLICWWTNSPFSHTEFVVDITQADKIIDAYRSGMPLCCWSASPREKRVRNKFIYPVKGRWTCVVLQGFDKTIAESYWVSMNGRFYDYPGVAGFVVKFIKQITKWLYCSEGAAAALIASANPDTPVPPRECSPGELFEWATLQSKARVFTF